MEFESFLNRHSLRPEVSSGVEPGWIPLLDSLIIQLRLKNWNGHVGQIKQKFGRLRFYTDDNRHQIRGLIREYHAKSSLICEMCGERGSLRLLSDKIQKTLCMHHFLISLKLL